MRKATRSLRKGSEQALGQLLLFSVNHQFEVCRLPGLNLHGLWLITCAEQTNSTIQNGGFGFSLS